MTGPFFSVGPCLRITFGTPGTLSDWIASLQNFLSQANWTTVSTFVGSGGTLGIIMRTFPTPNHQTAQLTVFWDGTQLPFGDGPVISFLMADSAAGNQAFIGQVSYVPGKTWEMVFGPHQFFLWSNAATPAFRLNAVMGGVPKTIGSGESFWGIGDGGNVPQVNFTNNLAGITSGNGIWAYLLNGTLAQRGSSGSNLPLQLLPQRSADFSGNDPILFADGTSAVTEPILAMLTSTVVYLWDAVLINHSFSTNLAFKYLGRTIEVVTLGFPLGALAVVSDSSTIPFEPGYAH